MLWNLLETIYRKKTITNYFYPFCLSLFLSPFRYFLCWQNVSSKKSQQFKMLLRFYEASNNILLLIPQVILFIFFGELLPTYTSIFIMIISTLCRSINLQTSNNQAMPPATSKHQLNRWHLTMRCNPNTI